MEQELRHAISLGRPREDVFDFLCAFERWPQWYPATVRVRSDAGPCRAGTQIVEYVRKLGLPGRLRWVVVECDRPERLVIETTSIEMPVFGASRLRISYELHREGTGTRMLRTWRYTLPTRLLRQLDRLFLRRNLTEESDGALATLRRLVEAAPADERISQGASARGRTAAAGSARR